jgi:hypothetical protein
VIVFLSLIVFPYTQGNSFIFLSSAGGQNTQNADLGQAHQNKKAAAIEINRGGSGFTLSY